MTGFGRKKLREASFFLDHMKRASATVVSESDHFEFYLSAFLSAARSVTFVMQFEDKTRYHRSFPNGDFGLDDSDNALLQKMNKRRVDVVHHEGATKDLTNSPDDIAVYDRYEDESGTYVVSAPPGLQEPPLTLRKARYYFVIDGANVDAINTCIRYAGILDHLVTAFENTPQSVSTGESQ